MSILVAGLDHAVALIAARRLIDEGDEVRVLLTEERFAAVYRDMGVYVASGTELGDPDLVERACQNVRTLVLGSVEQEVMKHILMGASPAGVGRIVYVAERTRDDLEILKRSGMEYVILRAPRPGLLRKNALDPEALAEAIDAADDLDGAPHLDLDLSRADAWEQLRLDPP